MGVAASRPTGIPRGAPDEFAELFDTILINVTSSSATPTAWELVATRSCRASSTQRRHAPHPHLVDGCATGEEAYTIAMLFAEVLGDDDFQRARQDLRDRHRRGGARDGRQALYIAKAARAVPPSCASGTSSRRTKTDSRSAAISGAAVIFGRHDLHPGPADLARRPARLAQHADVLRLRDAAADPRATSTSRSADGGVLCSASPRLVRAHEPVRGRTTSSGASS